MQSSDRKRKQFLEALKTRSDFDGLQDDAEMGVCSSELVAKLNSTLPSSVLTLALIYHICHEKEQNPTVRKEFFKGICDKLCELNYLNSTTVTLYKKLSLSSHYKILNYFLQEVHDKVRSACSLDVSRLLYEPIENEVVALKYPSNQYIDSFEELEVIGEGGSGTVYKAIHKVDRAVYAVKKIVFKFKNDVEFEKITREAKSFAALRHRNIVNYNNAWIVPKDETGEKLENSGESSEDDSIERLLENPSNANNSFSLTQGSFIESGMLREEVHDRFQSSHDSITEEDNSTEFCPKTLEKNSEAYHGVPTIKAISKQTTSEIVKWSVKDLRSSRNLLSTECCNLNQLSIRAELYIQMEYCKQDLDSWLKEKCQGSSSSSIDVISMFRQILCGVEYIHSKSIIHRDLKPKNIFITEPKKTVKIGDFGLACLVEQIEASSCTHWVVGSAVHGTVPYSAPEQRNGAKYDFKVDIYSLGIILFEFYFIGITRAEFMEKLKGFFEGKFRMQASIEVENLVNALITENPDERPTVGEILKNPLFKKKSLKKNIEDIHKKYLTCVNQVKALEVLVSKLREEQNECKEMFKAEVFEQNRLKDETIKSLIEEINLLKLER